MGRYSKKELDNDVSNLRKTIFSLIKELMSNQGDQPGTTYFNSTFHVYMGNIQPKAEALVEKYSRYFNKKVHGQFKEILQMMVEQGLDWYYYGVTVTNKEKLSTPTN